MPSPHEGDQEFAQPIIIARPVSLEELRAVAKQRVGDMIKAVVDIEKGIMAVGGDLHADEEALLLNDGSSQKDLWGINIYIEKPREEWVEFDSVINIRPSQENRSRYVENETLRRKIIEIINSLIT